MPLDENDLKQIKEMLSGVQTSIIQALPGEVQKTIAKMAEESKKAAPKPDVSKKLDKPAPEPDKSKSVKSLKDMTPAEIERLPRATLLQLQEAEFERRMQEMLRAQLEPVANTATATSAQLQSAQFLARYPEAKFLQNELKEIIERGEVATLNAAMAVLKHENPKAYDEAVIAYQKEQGTWKDPEKEKEEKEKPTPPLSLYARPTFNDTDEGDVSAKDGKLDNKSAAALAYDRIVAEHGVDLGSLPSQL